MTGILTLAPASVNLLMVAESLATMSTLLPIRTMGALPIDSSISGSQNISADSTVSGLFRSATTTTPWAPLIPCALILL